MNDPIESVEAVPSIDGRTALNGMQSLMATLPQLELGTEHRFADGMYARILSRMAGDLIVGKVHRREHFYIIAKGCVAVSDGGEPAQVHEAGTVLVSKPGTKRAVLALEDSICMTVHRTDKLNLDDIENELIEPDPGALFDAGNNLKAEAIE